MGIVKQLKTINRFRLFRGELKGSATPICVGFMLYLKNSIVKSSFESLDINAPEFFAMELQYNETYAEQILPLTALPFLRF